MEPPAAKKPKKLAAGLAAGARKPAALAAGARKPEPRARTSPRRSPRRLEEISPSSSPPELCSSTSRSSSGPSRRRSSGRTRRRSWPKKKCAGAACARLAAEGDIAVKEFKGGKVLLYYAEPDAMARRHGAFATPEALCDVFDVYPTI